MVQPQLQIETLDQPLTYSQIDQLNAQAWSVVSGDAQQGLTLSLQTRQLSQAIEYKPGLAYSYYITTTAFMMMADQNQTLSNGQLSLQLYRELGDRNGEAKALGMIANSYLTASDFEIALDYYLKAYQGFDETGDKTRLSLTLQNISYTYEQMEQYQTALEYYQKTLRMGEELNNKLRIGCALNGLGYCYLLLDQVADAQQYLLKALAMVTETGDTQTMSYVYSSLGSLYQKLTQPEQALEYFSLALELAKKMDFKVEQAKLLRYIGEIQQASGSYHRSAELYQQALEIAELAGSRTELYQTHKTYARLYEEQGAWFEAFRHHKLYAEIKAEVTNTENQKIITATHARFNLEKAEKESEIFRLRNVELAGALEEVAEANREIASLNQQLKAENLRMGAELEVTQRLQQMVLPRQEELKLIEGLEIAPFMLPATEVGGDYYDVLQHDGRVKIGIGDVTGHGLESGVLMLMVQTAVRSLLVSQQHDPTVFLTRLNQVIYNNVSRMHSDKNLSLLLLDYHNGTLIIAGQHEQVIIVRQNGRLELVDTVDLGFPIGLIEDVSEFIAYQQVQLAQGDLVVLYTDGITEAENQKRQQYGLERLCQVVQANHARFAAEIKQAVIDDLMTYINQAEILDDITLMVLKQLF